MENIKIPETKFECLKIKDIVNYKYDIRCLECKYNITSISRLLLLDGDSYNKNDTHQLIFKMKPLNPNAEEYEIPIMCNKEDYVIFNTHFNVREPFQIILKEEFNFLQLLGTNINRAISDERDEKYILSRLLKQAEIERNIPNTIKDVDMYTALEIFSELSSMFLNK